jgi:DNA modification methylase
MAQVIHGNNKEVLKTLADNSVDAIVTDPPYELKFMGRTWDGSGIAYDVEMWAECYRVLKPGGHLLSFGGTRTYHRMACAVEDAGFEIRDCIFWCYGSGFPKSQNISKMIDKKLGCEREVVGVGKYADRQRTSGTKTNALGAYSSSESDVITAPASPEAIQWDGYGTALKPANEPIVLARKPLSEKTIASNVLKWGVGGLNIDGCRVHTSEELGRLQKEGSGPMSPKFGFNDNKMCDGEKFIAGNPQGRFPANVIHDSSEEILELFPHTKSGSRNLIGHEKPQGVTGFGGSDKQNYAGDSGTAARFFYSAKTSTKERTCNGQVENKHPTVKPIALISYLCRLITPPGGTVLDPFAGSGTTALACMKEGFDYVLIELEEESYETCLARIAAESQS